MNSMRDILQALMGAYGHSEYDLEGLCGVPQPTTYRFLKGNHGEPRKVTTSRWASAYKISEAQLMGFEPLPDELVKFLAGKGFMLNGYNTNQINNLVDRDTFWEQITYCYRGMSEKNRDALALIANALYVSENPSDRLANPFGGKKMKEKAKVMSLGTLETSAEGVVDNASNKHSGIPQPGTSNPPGKVVGGSKKG